VELAAPGLLVPLGRGAVHTRRLLTALALWQPGAAAAPARGAARLRELHVSLG
jgi:hypothetical protein